jgi:hypothetical protein
MTIPVEPPRRYSLSSTVHCPDCRFQKSDAPAGEQLPHLCLIGEQLVYRLGTTAIPVEYWMVQTVEKS